MRRLRRGDQALQREVDALAIDGHFRHADTVVKASTDSPSSRAVSRCRTRTLSVCVRFWLAKCQRQSGPTRLPSLGGNMPRVEKKPPARRRISFRGWVSDFDIDGTPRSNGSAEQDGWNIKANTPGSACRSLDGFNSPALRIDMRGRHEHATSRAT